MLFDDQVWISWDVVVTSRFTDVILALVINKVQQLSFLGLFVGSARAAI
jgi:hypothetical protein